MFVITEDIRKLLALTDLVLLDIKHINPKKCKKLVGISNTLELTFAKFLSEEGIKIWLRQVIIPGITDNKEDLIELRNFIHSLKSIEKVELLPYHNIGKTKWEELGYDYPMNNVRTATAEDIENAKDILNLEENKNQKNS